MVACGVLVRMSIDPPKEQQANKNSFAISVPRVDMPNVDALARVRVGRYCAKKAT